MGRDTFVMIPTWMLDAVADRSLPAATLLTFTAVARYANGRNGRGSFPGQERIATETQQSVRTVRNHLKALEAAGAIKATARYVRGHRTSDSYVVTTGKKLPVGEGHTGKTEHVHTGNESPSNHNQGNHNQFYSPESVDGEAVAGFRGDLTDSSSDETTVATDEQPERWDEYVDHCNFLQRTNPTLPLPTHPEWLTTITRRSAS